MADVKDKTTKASKLVNDLTKIPNIVGGLGLSIAAAQKAFNLDYLDSVERILAMALILGGEKKEDTEGTVEDMAPEEAKKSQTNADLFKNLLLATAPSRYQYTETTLAVKLDLAQSIDVSGSVGLGLGYGGIALNGSISMSYGSDYRAAAEVRSVIHAIPADNTVFSSLLERAKGFGEKVLDLPSLSVVDEKIIEIQSTIVNKLVETNPPKVKEE